MSRYLLAAVFLLSVGLSLSGADWLRFRGPNGSGVAEGPLPPIDPKTPLWKVPVPGKGAGSPIVVGGKVYLQSATEDGARRLLICLDGASGKTEWIKELPGEKAPTHALNTLASSTPASDGERLYCVWWDGTAMSVHGYDLSGKELWSDTLGPFKSQHGVGHSPIVHKGKVFVCYDQDGESSVVAVDARSGTRLWTAARKPERACYNTPVILEEPGKPAALIITSTHSIDSYDPDSGKVNWHYTIKWPAGATVLRSVGGQVLTNGLVIAYYGEGGGKGTRYAVAVKTNGSGDVTATGKAWESKKGTPYVPAILAKDGLLFWAYDSGGKVLCADAKTGKPVWDEQVYKQDSGAVYSSPILVGDQLVIVSELGQVAIMKAGRTFDEPTLVKLGEKEKFYASPAFADSRLYIRGMTNLYCFGKK
jgi:outer membrane protein assembly factor BamB